MPDELVARVIFEEGIGGGAAPGGPANEEQKQNQRKQTKALSELAGFFAGGKGALLVKGIAGLGTALGPGGVIATALAGGAISALSKNITEPIVKGFFDAFEGREERKTREETVDIIEDENSSRKDLDDALQDSRDTLSDSVGRLGDAQDTVSSSIESADFPGLLQGVGQWAGALINSITDIRLFSEAVHSASQRIDEDRRREWRRQEERDRNRDRLAQQYGGDVSPVVRDRSDAGRLSGVGGFSSNLGDENSLTPAAVRQINQIRTNLTPTRGSTATGGPFTR